MAAKMKRSQWKRDGEVAASCKKAEVSISVTVNLLVLTLHRAGHVNCGKSYTAIWKSVQVTSFITTKHVGFYVKRVNMTYQQLHNILSVMTIS